MKITKALITQTWKTLSTQTYSRYWGFLLILQNIKIDKSNFKPGEGFKFDTKIISDRLQDLFLLTGTSRTFGNQQYSIIFSNFWKDSAPEFLLKTANVKPAIKDVVVFLNHYRSFTAPLQLKTLVEEFLANVNIPEQDLSEFVDLDFTDLSIPLENDFVNADLISEFKNSLQIDLNAQTLTFDSPFSVQANPGELSRAPFFQSLYSNQEGPKSFLINQFDFNTHYLIGSVSEAYTNAPEELNMIFYGPPGTGKTREIQKGYLDDKSDDEKDFITFHQAYSYEEFVEGIKPEITIVSDGDGPRPLIYSYADGAFYKACEQAVRLAGFESLEACLKADRAERTRAFSEAATGGKNFHFCIDEINRANISAVFGDLISLIEPSKRLGAEEELIVGLPYSKRRFGVPGNLKIIGSMNTADRSITLMDTALRRRFIFKEIGPEPAVLASIVLGDIKLASLLERINRRVTYFLGKDLCVGHAYFLPLARQDAPTANDLLSIFLNKILPLLEEYFYSDKSKVRMVLGDQSKSEAEFPFYVKDDKSDPSVIFAGAEDLEENDVYVLNPNLASFLEPGASEIPEICFTKIYA